MRPLGVDTRQTSALDSRWQRGPVFADIHCHCLPGLDDGPADVIASLALCRALAADHVATVVATPHQLGRYDGRHNAATIREATAALNERLVQAGIGPKVLAGADVRIDERLVDLLEADEVLTVADGGRYLLLELPHNVFVDPVVLIGLLAEAGIVSVITHPERHGFLAQNPRYVERWVRYGPCLQITAGSLLGDFGRGSQRAAWAFLGARVPLVVATDAHGAKTRPPRMTAAYRALRQHAGREVADVLCVENPRRVLAGEELLLVTREPVHREVE
jgi:protein-tyrosine phosphatase